MVNAAGALSKHRSLVLISASFGLALLLFWGVGSTVNGLFTAAAIALLGVSGGFFHLMAFAILSMTVFFLIGQPIAVVCAMSACFPAILMILFPVVRSNEQADGFDLAQPTPDRLEKLLHDLRTPLNGVTGALELLERRDLDDRGRKYVALGQKSATNMAALIDGLDQHAGRATDTSAGPLTSRRRSGHRSPDVVA